MEYDVLNAECLSVSIPRRRLQKTVETTEMRLKPDRKPDLAWSHDVSSQKVENDSVYEELLSLMWL